MKSKKQSTKQEPEIDLQGWEETEAEQMEQSRLSHEQMVLDRTAEHF